MDSDMPLPSIEHDEEPVSTRTTTFTSFRDTKGSSPLASSPPNRTPFRTPLSRPTSPESSKTPRSPSLSRNDRRSTPSLQTQRSSSSLAVSRGQTPGRIQLRRVSSNLNPASPTINMKSPESFTTPPPLPLTAGSVAKEYFGRELQAHSGAQSKTAIFVHDSCYGHRFSRPKTSKTALSTIVERPERIHATLLGASAAYVRLGDRHTDGAYGPHPDRDITMLPNPPFLIKKTTRSIALNHPAVTQVHGVKWMEELQIMCDSAESKLALNGKELQRPIGYGKDDNGNNLSKLHEGDLYLCSESLDALQGCLGGVCDAIDAVFLPSAIKRAFVCIRPPGHHCSSDYPSGFCWLNNVHVGISYAAMSHGLTHAAIIDFDLHHGDGSQTITWDHNHKAQSLPKNAAQHKKTPIGYYSLHDINSYPCEWGDEDKVQKASLCIENAHGQSVWNVHLEPWTSLEHFWQIYETKYSVLLEKARSFLKSQSDRLRQAGIQPKAAIFLSAGFDASQWEGQGMQRHNVNIPTEFYARFTSDVVELASELQLGVDGRVISVLEGGYSDRALTSGVLSHLCGLTSDPASSTEKNQPPQQSLDGGGNISNDVSLQSFTYDPEWWQETHLEALESRVAGNIPPPVKKKDKATGTYSSPTQASYARMTEVARERKSLSAQLESRLRLENAEPEPPPPVDWVTAAYELSRILIPSDRSTLSCRHDELNAEATKIRRERQSMIGLPAPEPRMQLRTRGKGPTAEPEAVRAASRTSSRRTTIAAVSELPDASNVSRRPRRRSSAASSVLSSFQDMRLDDGTRANEGQAEATQRLPSALDASQTLPSKKTRMAPPAKKTTTRTSSPRKSKATTQLAPQGTSLQERLNGTKRQADSAASQSKAQPRKSSHSSSINGDNIDDLTNGMKKVSIKLKMPTPEQHAENQRKAEEAKLKKSQTARKAAVPKLVKSKAVPATALNHDVQPLPSPPQDVSRSTGMVQGQRSAPVEGPNVLGPRIPDDAATTEDVSDQINAASRLDSAPFPPDLMVTDLKSGNGNHIADTEISAPQRPPGSEHVVPPQYVQLNDDPPTKRTKADLPIFTSSSPIPFAGEQLRMKQEETKRTAGPPTWSIADASRP